MLLGQHGSSSLLLEKWLEAQEMPEIDVSNEKA